MWYKIHPHTPLDLGTAGLLEGALLMAPLLLAAEPTGSPPRALRGS